MIVVDGNSDQTYMNFTAYKLKGVSYITPGAGANSPDASSMLCNMKLAGVCGSPMPQGQTLMCGQDITDLLQWFACGAPQN